MIATASVKIDEHSSGRLTAMVRPLERLDPTIGLLLLLDYPPGAAARRRRVDYPPCYTPFQDCSLRWLPGATSRGPVPLGGNIGSPLRLALGLFCSKSRKSTKRQIPSINQTNHIEPRSFSPVYVVHGVRGVFAATSHVLFPSMHLFFRLMEREQQYEALVTQ